MLSSIGTPGRFHWGIYLRIGENMGFIAHAIHPTRSLSSLDWEMEYVKKTTLENSLTLVLALKIGALRTSRLLSYESSLKDKALLAESLSSDFSCRVWVKLALDFNPFAKSSKEKKAPAKGKACRS